MTPIPPAGVELSHKPLDIKPCPFCGKRLVHKLDNHGWYWAHELEPGPCFISHVQLLDAIDIEAWNRRGK